jgi:hypothetical protein
MELSLRCDQDINITIFDPSTQQMLQYKSSEDFDMKTIHVLESNQNVHFKRDQFSNDDFALFNEKLSVKEIKELEMERALAKGKKEAEELLPEKASGDEEDQKESEVEEINRLLSKFIRVNPYNDRNLKKRRVKNSAKESIK